MSASLQENDLTHRLAVGEALSADAGQSSASDTTSKPAIHQALGAQTTTLEDVDTSEPGITLLSGLLASNKAHGYVPFANNVSTAKRQAASLVNVNSSGVLDGNELGLMHNTSSNTRASEESPFSSRSEVKDSISNSMDKSLLQPAPVPKLHMHTSNRNDLLIVIPSSMDRMPIVAASRDWRQGVQTYIAFEEEINIATAPSVFKVCCCAALC